MVKFRHLLAAIFICSTLASICALAQSSLTQIRDTITNSNGTPFNGMLVITWNGFAVPSGTPVSQLSASARIYNGALSVLLVPTTTATAGTYYQVVYSSSDGTVTWTETWQVPPSTTPLIISQVRQSTTQGSGGPTANSSQYATLPIAINQVTNLSSSLSSLNTAVSTLNTQVAALGTSTNIANLQSTVNSLSSTVSGLSGTVNGVTSTVSGLTTTVASNGAALTALTSNVGTVNSTVSGLSASVTTLTNIVNGLSSTVSALSASGSTAAFVDAQVPSGTQNGANTAFSLANTPSPVASLALYRNGLLQASGVDYTLAGTALTFSAASVPLATDVLQAFYRMPGSGTSSTVVDAETPGGTINGLNLAFTLLNPPSPAISLKVYKNGLLLSQNGDYTVSGSTITFTSQAATPQTGDNLLSSYRH